MEKFLEINSLSLAIFGLSIFGILEVLYLRHKTSSEIGLSKKATDDAALLAILHNLIFTNGCKYIKRGKVTVAELNDLEKLYAPYLSKGGNSTAKVIVENVRELPIDDGLLDGEDLDD